MLGMGKLGSRELTAGSDVDLILLYDHDADAEESDGDKPLAPSHYYTRLTQRLIAAVSAPTAEGVLYELDLRLRPSGNKGPVATHIDAFRKYQRQEAWTWEHMALTRARAVAGDAGLAPRSRPRWRRVLAMPRDPAKVPREAAEMRAMIEKEKPPRDLWDIKLIPGGLIDLEFIAQIARCSPDRSAGPVDRRTETVLARSRDGFADRAQRAGARSPRLRCSPALTQMMRLCLTGPFEPDDVPPGLSDLLWRPPTCRTGRCSRPMSATRRPRSGRVRGPARRRRPQGLGCAQAGAPLLRTVFPSEPLLFGDQDGNRATFPGFALGDGFAATFVAALRTGMRTDTMVPTPSVERIFSAPPCSSASEREMARPRPEPAWLLVNWFCTCSNGRPSLPSLSLGMPQPLSSIVSTMALATLRALTEMWPPWPVNFTALDRRLMAICLIARRSANSDMFSAMSVSTVIDFLRRLQRDRPAPSR